MIVVDAAAALTALLNAGPARRALATEQIHAPHLSDLGAPRHLPAYDATYVAPAELPDCSLFTADHRLARAPGTGCPITVVPR